MNVYVGNRLPSTYQEVEYIESSGTQWINTGVYVNPDYTVEASFIKTQNVTFGTLFGTRNNTLKRFIFRSQSDISAFKCQRCYNDSTSYGEEYTITSGYSDSNKHTIKMNRYVYRDGTLVNTFSATTTSWTSTYTLGIFALHAETDNVYDYGYYKLYYLKIWDSSNNLVRSFIPCYRKSDNVIGLFDKVENKFYANAGTGTFTKGNDVKVFQAELKNAYIGEVWTPGSNTIAYYPLTSTTTVNDMSGNNMNLTNYSATFGTYQGVNSVNIVGDSKYILGNISSIPQGANARTFNFWTYNSNGSVASSGIEAYFFTGTESTNQMILFMCGESGANYNRVSQYGTGSGTNFGTPKRQQWVNMCLVYDGTKFICYENGIKKGEWTYTINTSGTKFSLGVKRYGSASNWNKFSGYFSNFIIENKTWTAEEVLCYYNQTKSNYGL